MKRSAVILLTLLLIALLVPAFAAEVASGTCGDNLTWSLDDSGTLTISGTGAMYDYYSDSSSTAPWYDSYRASIKVIVIQPGVTSIGLSAFYGCSNLTSVTIPGSVTNIKGAAFYNCNKLTKIYIDNLEQWLSNNHRSSSLRPRGMGELYINGELLTELVIPEGVTSLSEDVFQSCSCLTSVVIPTSMTSISNYAFTNCSNLQSVTIPDSITTIGSYAFYSCTSLQSVTIPDSVTSIGDFVFDNCTSLQCVTIPDSVISIGDWTFYNCTKLSEIHVDSLAQWLGYDHTSYIYLYSSGDLYIGGTPLTEAVIPFGETAIGNYTFRNCTSLQSVSIPDSVTSIGDSAFLNCTSLQSVTIPDSVVSIGYGAFNQCSSLQSVTIPDSVTFIGDYAFYQCTSLQSITIPDSVIRINSGAFSNCSELSSIRVDSLVQWLGYDHNNSYLYLQSSGDLYVGGTRLTEAVIPDSVTSIGNSAFRNCTSLQSVTIPDSVTSIDYYAFRNCTSLQNVTIPDSVTSISYSAFYQCSKLSEIHVDSLAQWLSYDHSSSYLYLQSSGDLYIGGKPLTEAVIPDSVTKLTRYTFYNCRSLRKLVIPDSVTDVHHDIFTDNVELYELTIPAAFGRFTDIPQTVKKLTVTGSGSIGTESFYRLSKLTDVTICEGITAIEMASFRCDKLKNVLIPISVSGIDDNAFYDTGNGCVLNVYCWQYSYAEQWARAKGHNVILLDGFSFAANGVVTMEDMTLYTGDTAYSCGGWFPQTSGLTPVWTSADPSVVSADSTGNLTAHTAGTTTVTLSVSGKSATATVTVLGVRPTAITIPEEVWIPMGQSLQLTASITPEDAYNEITWSVSNDSYATVDATGLVTLKNLIGTFTVTATDRSGISASCSIHAISPVSKVELEPSELLIADGLPRQLTATVTCGSQTLINQYVAFISSDPTVVEVSADGIVTPLRSGTATVTAQCGTHSATATVTVASPITEVRIAPTLTFGVCRTAPCQLTATAISTDGEYGIELLTFSADNDAVATVTADGILTVNAAGTVHVTAAASNGVSAVCTVTVGDAHISKSFTADTAPTCGQTGCTAHYTCDDCGLFFRAEDGVYIEISEADWLIPTVDIHHCASGICRDCGRTFSTDGLNTLTLPSSLRVIESEAFSETGAQAIIVPSCSEIRSGAFADCGSLQLIFLPAALEGTLPADTFGSHTPVIVYQ